MSSCTENSLPKDDLGSFYTPKDSGQDLMAFLEYPNIEGYIFEIEQPYVVLAGLTRKVTMTNPDPGEPLPGVQVSVYDMSQSLLAQTVSDKEGKYVLAFHVSSLDIDGYVEAKKHDFPIVRQFDRPIIESWTNMRLRLLEEHLLRLSLSALQQKDELGYVQGSIYDKVTEKPIPNIRIEADKGEVAYLQDGIPLPNKELKETQSQGVFFVSNCQPGPLTIRAYQGDKLLVQRMVLTWSGKVITQVGLPVILEE